MRVAAARGRAGGEFIENSWRLHCFEALHKFGVVGVNKRGRSLQTCLPSVASFMISAYILCLDRSSAYALCSFASILRYL